MRKKEDEKEEKEQWKPKVNIIDNVVDVQMPFNKEPVRFPVNPAKYLVKK